MKDADAERHELAVPLAEMIQALRRELEKAQKSAAGQSITFTTEKVELELKVAVTRSKKGGGGIDFYVKVGGEYVKGDETAHTFKLTLLPVSSTGGRVSVNADTDEGPAGFGRRQE